MHVMRSRPRFPMPLRPATTRSSVCAPFSSRPSSPRFERSRRRASSRRSSTPSPVRSSQDALRGLVPGSHSVAGDDATARDVQADVGRAPRVSRADREPFARRSTSSAPSTRSTCRTRIRRERMRDAIAAARRGAHDEPRATPSNEAERCGDGDVAARAHRAPRRDRSRVPGGVRARRRELPPRRLRRLGRRLPRLAARAPGRTAGASGPELPPRRRRRRARASDGHAGAPRRRRPRARAPAHATTSRRTASRSTHVEDGARALERARRRPARPTTSCSST